MKKLKPNFEFSDKRGLFIEVWKSNRWRRMNYLFCKKGYTRGAHYHKKSKELFFIIEGACEVNVINLKTNKKNKLKVKAEDIFIIEPYELHYIKALKDSKIIALLDTMHDTSRHDMYLYEK